MILHTDDSSWPRNEIWVEFSLSASVCDTKGNNSLLESCKFDLWHRHRQPNQTDPEKEWLRMQQSSGLILKVLELCEDWIGLWLQNVRHRCSQQKNVCDNNKDVAASRACKHWQLIDVIWAASGKFQALVPFFSVPFVYWDPLFWCRHHSSATATHKLLQT